MSKTSSERGSTMVELVDALLQLPPTPGVLAMLADALAGEYHDYKNFKYTCGKLAVVMHLEAEANLPKTPKAVRDQLRELSKRVQGGDFDEEADEDDKAMMRKTTPRNMWGMLGL